MGGLSEHDARQFLEKCQVHDSPLQAAILRVSKDIDTPSLAADPEKQEVGYHPFSLGLCADTCFNLRRRGETIDAEQFDMSPAATQELAARFLRSFGSDRDDAEWLKRLALTLRFDQQAAGACHGGSDTQQQAAWQALLAYSFVQPAGQPGWYRLHAQMRDALEDLLERKSNDVWQANHRWWRTHWSERSAEAIDEFAELAWYHWWRLELEPAQLHWNELIENERQNLRMTSHAALITWWESCKLEDWLSDPERRYEAAAGLNDLGCELRESTISSRKQNLVQAITCYERALRVYTEADFPQDWAMTQNNLGNAYGDLPTGDRGANLREAIACCERALRVYTEADFPQAWATTQNNLGNAYGDLPTGDRGANLREAIACYERALRVRTEADFPQAWAMTQNNLGTAYQELPTGDRGANLRAAIDCYARALRVYTETGFPQAWAMTQNNLGTAYKNLPTGDRGTNLREAIACYERALRVHTEADLPGGFADTTANLSIIEWYIAKEWKKGWIERFEVTQSEMWKNAEVNLIKALEVFERINHEHHAERHRELLERLRQERAAFEAEPEEE
ncbi:tetratricopeptide repeat protein [Bremerella cremea]|uniref:tetratricopeptide repeat protein n=1 Tax=Bremerella cremea TaxID=1031537 RepID=UPI0031EA4945